MRMEQELSLPMGHILGVLDIVLDNHLALCEPEDLGVVKNAIADVKLGIVDLYLDELRKEMRYADE